MIFGNREATASQSTKHAADSAGRLMNGMLLMVCTDKHSSLKKW
jgi:hypothetical protein